MFNSLCYSTWQQPYPNTLNQPYNLTIVTPPSVEPVTYAELSDQCRAVDTTDDQPYITLLGMAGRQYVETATKLTLIQTTYDVSFDVMDNNGIRLPRRPVTSVVSVKYTDQSGNVITLDPSQYDVDTKSIWTTIRPKPTSVFPVTSFSPNAVTVRFTAGTTTDTATVSPMAKLAVTSWVAHQYENREAASETAMKPLPYAFDAILMLLSAPGV